MHVHRDLRRTAKFVARGWLERPVAFDGSLLLILGDWIFAPGCPRSRDPLRAAPSRRIAATDVNAALTHVIEARSDAGGSGCDGVLGERRHALRVFGVCLIERAAVFIGQINIGSAAVIMPMRSSAMRACCFLTARINVNP